MDHMDNKNNNKNNNENNKPIDEIIIEKMKLTKQKLTENIMTTKEKTKHYGKVSRQMAKLGVFLISGAARQCKKRILKPLYISGRMNLAVYFMDPIRRRRTLAITTASLALCIGSGLLYQNITSYEYGISGKTLGTAECKNDVIAMIPSIKAELKADYGANVNLKEEDISFRTVHGFDTKTLNQKEIKESFAGIKDIQVTAYDIVVDGFTVATLAQKSDANQLLKSLEARYKQPQTKYEKTYYLEKVKVQPREAKLLELDNSEAALNYIVTGYMEDKTHIIAQGETLSEISKTYNMKEKELVALNPELVPERLKIGAKINLLTPKPFITVVTEQTVKYQDSIPYEIAYENTQALYKDETNVKSMGTNGVKDVTAVIQNYNGQEVVKTEIASTVISEPISQVVLVGTKEKPLYIATGSYISPTRGTVTSRYGTRWSRQHAGIDIAAPTGTSIYAADGGTITFSGWKNGYGNAMEISHSDGTTTFYAHCSKLLVKSGDKVYQGQEIGKVGNTGNSTGPHLHFEVRENGVAKNPLNYVNY